MRHLLTAIGILICVALTTAMAAPHLIDWGQYRGFFESRIADMTGRPARILGPIKLTLLPTPTLSLSQVRIGAPDAAGFPMFEADRIAGALAPMPLLRGELAITEAYLDGPILRIGPGGLAAMSGPPIPNNADVAGAISIEKLEIRDGTAVVARKGREDLTISAIVGELEANSLLGPAKGSGDFVDEGGKRHIRFAVGRAENGKMRVKALIEDLQLALRVDVDGVAALGEDAPVRFEGALGLTGNTALGIDEKVQLPLRAGAKARLEGEKLALADITLTVGQEPQPLSLAGAGSVTFGARPFYDLTLVARSYDFDRPGPDGRPRRAVPAELIRQVTALLPARGAAEGGVDGMLDISAGALVIGGQTVIAPHAVLSQGPDGARLVRLDGELPGQTRLVFERGADAGAGPVSGRLRIDSRDPEKLNGWFNGVARTVTAAAAVKAEATLAGIKDGVAITRIDIERGSTLLSGEGRYLLTSPALRPAPRLELKLVSQRLDIADIPAFIVGGEGREEKADLDFDFDIAAERLVLEGRETGRLTAKARRDGAITSIERIAITGLDGANLVVSGALGGGSRRVTVKLDAEKLEGIAAVVERVAPGAFANSLRRRVAFLAPALVVASLANDETEDSFTLNAEGRFGGSEINANGKVQAKADIFIDVALSAQNPDGARLAQQLSGLGRTAGAATQPGNGRLTVKGNPRAAMDLSFTGALLGLSVDVGGQIRLFQPFSPFEGALAARAGDVAAPFAALGVDPALLPTGAASLTAKVQSNLQKITLLDVKSVVGGVAATGEVAFKLAEGGQVAGQLRLPQIDLRPLIASVTGRTPLVPGAAGWSPEAFGKAAGLPLAGDMWVEAGRATLGDGLSVSDARFVLRFADGAISVEHGNAQGAAARLSGDVFLRRTGPTVTTSARLKAADLDLDKLLPAGFKGGAEGELSLSGAGDTPAKLAQSLAGSGALALRSLVVPGHDPAALGRLLAIPPQTIGPVDAANIGRRLEAELAKAPLAAPEARLPIVVIDGMARFGGALPGQGGVRHELTGALDLGRPMADVRLVTGASPDPAAPQFTVQWRGAPGAVKRSLAVDQLVNVYLVAALQRDAERTEIMEQDLRERAYFNRRLKAMEAEKRSAEEIRLDGLKQDAIRQEILRQETMRQQQARDQLQRAAPGGGEPLDLRPQ